MVGEGPSVAFDSIINTTYDQTKILGKFKLFTGLTVELIAFLIAKISLFVHF
tara:strand:+ start:348 stop:503 length:156 start_codon:yes stop_codon:yes gene_type:complete